MYQNNDVPTHTEKLHGKPSFPHLRIHFEFSRNDQDPGPSHPPLGQGLAIHCQAPDIRFPFICLKEAKNYTLCSCAFLFGP